MDPLPFLVFSILVFWLAQIVAWGLWQYKKPQPPVTGLGDVKPSQYIQINKGKKK
jgi:hypothetical protein